MTSDGSPQSDYFISNADGDIQLKDEHTALVSVLHSGNRVSILRAQAEARCGAVVPCVDDLVLENLCRGGCLADFEMSVGEGFHVNRAHSLVTTVICPRTR